MQSKQKVTMSVWDRRLLNFFARYIEPRPTTFALLCLALVAVIGFGAKSLQFTTDYRIYFDTDNPQLVAYENIQMVYSKDDNAIVAIQPKSGTIFNKKSLELLYEITEQSWQLPHSLRVDSLTNFAHSSADAEGLVISDLVEDPTTLDEQSIAFIQSIARTDELVKGALVSDDGTMALVKVTFALDDLDPVVVGEIAGALDTTLEGLRIRYPDHDIMATGNILAGASFAESAKRDLSTLIPLMYVAMIVVLCLTIKSMSGVFIVVLTIGLSTVICFGFMGWAGIDLSTSTAIAPTIVMTLAIADVVHLLSTFYRGYGLGQERIEAIRNALAENFLPMFLTSFTTAIGFLSMNFNKVPPFRELGNIVAVGVGGAFLLVITIVPALLIVLPAKRRAVKKEASSSRLAPLVIRYKNHIMGVSAALFLLSATGFPLLEVNDSVTKYFDESYSFRTDSDRINNAIGGLDMIDFSLESSAAQGITDPQYLRWVAEFVAEAEKDARVAHVSSVASVFRKINKNMHGDDPEHFRLPESSELAAQYLLLYEMSLPAGRDLSNVIAIDKTSSRVTLTLSEVSTKEVRQIAEHMDQWLRDNPLRGQASAQLAGTGLAVVFANIYLENIWGMILGTVSAVVLITITLMVAMRSWKYGLLSLLPNILPIAMTFGIWGYANGIINLASSGIAMIAIGIVVDDTIHFLTKYLRFKRTNGASSRESVIYAIQSVGHAMWVTSVVLIAGFGVLAFSGFQLNASMGILTAITIAFALIADLALLPALLMWMDTPGDEAQIQKHMIEYESPAKERSHG